MLYEPIKYIMEYEISAVAFLIIIMVRFFSVKRFPNQKNTLFSVILWTILADMLLDIVSSIIISNVFSFSSLIVYSVNIAFYSLQILLPLLMTMYSLAIANRLRHEYRIKSLFIVFPGVAMLVLMLLNPFTHWFFYVDSKLGYLHGHMFFLIYVTFMFYMLETFVITFRHRKSLTANEYNTICGFLLITFIATLVQFLYPALLLTGVAIAMSVILMYFTIQNPNSMMDTTTGAFTYDAMLTFLQDRVNENERIQLVAIKVQNMSRINELLGIENGSGLLRQISSYMRASGENVWVFRMRGSCFVAVTRSRKDYISLKERMEKRAEQLWMVGSTEVLLQATLCCLDADELFNRPVTSEDAIKIFETAFLQNDKSGERISCITVDTKLLEKKARRQAVENALREALVTESGLELYFQPLWSVKKKHFDGAEVLIRFHHCELGVVSPDEFIPIAESCGLITELDKLVVRKTCALIEKSNYEELGIERFEINLSALEFMQQSLPELLCHTMSRYSVNPAFLCFEVTETAATESFEVLKDCMEKIRKFGCTFALDDFGTGYANITRVLSLPFSVVKLDKSLLGFSADVIEDLTRMFGRLNHSVVVEGVETSEQACLCAKCGVDSIQGFFYAKPMNQVDFEKCLKENTSIDRVAV